MNDMNAPINTQRLAAVEQSIALAKDLVSNFYLPDLLAIGKIYVEKGTGRGWWPCEKTRYVLWRLS